MGCGKSRKKVPREKLPPIPVTRSQRRWNITKIVLRSIALALSITALGLAVAIDRVTFSQLYWAFVAFPALSVFISWDTIEFIVIIIRRDNFQGIHPGAHVAFELLFWLGTSLTVAFQAYTTIRSQILYIDDVEFPYDANFWAPVAVTQLSILGFLLFLRFVFFIRACVETNRKNKDRRVQELVWAIQKQGHDPQDIPLSLFRKAREQEHGGASTVLKAISKSTTPTTRSIQTADSTKPPQTKHYARVSIEDRDFTVKYNFPIVTVPELLESGIHPEDARNQKVLIGAFPRQR
ncbi:hypothetical protein F4808DRAFT_410420 [Astrocystis sublimbata]|nr:hypothetical protein F4808DRAFT_410420 [Astrocystis sublimbata]